MPPSIDQRRAVLRDAYPVWHPRTLDQALFDFADQYGDRPLVLTDDRSLTYREAAEWTRRLADGLAASGVRPGDRVGLLMANYLEFVPLKFAIAAVGAVAVPFNYLYRSDELAYVLAQSRVSVLITMTGFAQLDYLGIGFWEKPVETAEALRAGQLRSGDLGRVRPDGYIQLTGRAKELYKSGGELVMPKEIEELLSRHPGISQAYAVGVPDDRWGEVGCVWVVLEPSSTVTAEDVLALCKENLARFKVPKHVFFTTAADLPTTPTGKVQKFELTRRAKDLLASNPSDPR